MLVRRKTVIDTSEMMSGCCHVKELEKDFQPLVVGPYPSSLFSEELIKFVLITIRTVVINIKL